MPNQINDSNPLSASKKVTQQLDDKFQDRTTSYLASLTKHLTGINERAAEDITKTYLNINALIDDLEAIQNAVIHKHKTDFTADYKEHMLKVQVELFTFKKKASEYY